MIEQNILCAILFPFIQNNRAKRWDLRLHHIQIKTDEAIDIAETVNEAVLGMGFIPTEGLQGYGIGTLFGYRPYERDAPDTWQADHPDNVIYSGFGDDMQVMTLNELSSPTEFQFNIPEELFSETTLIKYLTRMGLPVCPDIETRLEDDMLVIPLYPGQTLRSRNTGELVYIIPSGGNIEPNGASLFSSQKTNTIEFGLT